ncbi:MAG: RidA family protein [Oscillospiraceae bacterium]
MKKVIATKNAPGALGPYSQAISMGNFLFASGQLGLVPETGEFAGADVVSQTIQALKNLGAILKEAGMDYSSVVKTTVFLKDMNDFAAMNAEYAKFFTSECPARCAFEVAKLPKNGLVEIDAIACKE